jgi:glycosyltransferase involved in cell wall biosynthesis
MDSTDPMTPINILYMIDSLAYGGAERQLVELIRRLDRGRFRPYLCVFEDHEGLYDIEVPKITLSTVRFNHYSILKKLLVLNRFIRENRIHIVQTFFQDPFLLAAMASHFNRVKLVGTFLDLGFWRTPAENRKMRLAYPFFSGFIANSRAVKDHFVLTDGIPEDKIQVIYNGFDFSAIPEVISRRCAYSPPVIGIVANMNRPVKRVEDFVRAAALVKEKVPGARFIVVGDGHLRGGLEEQAESLGLGRSIHFTGRISNPLEVVCTFDIGVLTSETEGFSNAIIEYMACGVPVVVTDTGGNPELVTEGENGFLVPVGRYESLAEKVVQLLSSNEQCARMGERNREKIRSGFSWSVALERQCSYYENLVAE